MEHEYRPWGAYYVIEQQPSHKVKRIVVNPGGRLSYQYHHNRAEVWTIVSGTALVTIEGITTLHEVGSVVQIPLLAKHRIENPGNEPLVFIEVQWGKSFEEDDIVRLEDDYARCPGF